MPLGALVSALGADEVCRLRSHPTRLSPVKDSFSPADKESARPAEAHHAGRAFLSSQWRLSSLYRALGALEAAVRVPAVAERLGGRAAAAAQGDRPVLLVRREV